MHDCVVLMLCCDVTVQSLLSRVQKYTDQCKLGPHEAQHGRAFMLRDCVCNSREYESDVRSDVMYVREFLKVLSVTCK